MKFAAAHESGHAVMSVITGRRVKSVDIHRVDDRGGLTRLHEEDGSAAAALDPDSPDGREWLRRMALVWLAGPVSQELARGQTEPILLDASDEEVIWCSEPCQRIGQDFQWVKFTTTAVLQAPPTQRALSTISSLLKSRQEISGELVERVVAASGAGALWPEPPPPPRGGRRIDPDKTFTTDGRSLRQWARALDLGRERSFPGIRG